MALVQAVATQGAQSLGFLSPRTSPSDAKIPSFTETWNAIQSEKNCETDASGANSFPSPDMAKGRQKLAKSGDSQSSGLAVGNVVAQPVVAVVADAQVANAASSSEEEKSAAKTDLGSVSSATTPAIAFQLAAGSSMPAHLETRTSSTPAGNWPNLENSGSAATKANEGTTATMPAAGISQPVVTPEAIGSSIPEQAIDSRKADPFVFGQHDEKNQRSTLDPTQDAGSSARESKHPGTDASITQELPSGESTAESANQPDIPLTATGANPVISSADTAASIAPEIPSAGEIFSKIESSQGNPTGELSASSPRDTARSNVVGGAIRPSSIAASGATGAMPTAGPQAVENTLSATCIQTASGAPAAAMSPSSVCDSISVSLGIQAGASARAGLKPQSATSMSAGVAPSPAPAHAAANTKNDNKNSSNGSDAQTKAAPANASSAKPSSDDAKAGANQAASQVQVPTQSSPAASSPANDAAPALVNAHPILSGSAASGNVNQKSETVPEAAVASPAAHASLPLPAPGPVQAAQILNKAGQSEMRIGMNTTAFGSVEVRTTVHAADVGVVIGSERGDLHNLMANDLPAIANSLEQHNLRLNQVSFQSGLAFSSQSQSQSQDGSQSGRFSASAAAPAMSSSTETKRESVADTDRETRPEWHSGISILA